MELLSLVASAMSVLIVLGGIIVSRIYYSRTSRLVHKHERTTQVLEKSVDQVYVMLTRLSHESEEAYERIESGVNHLAEAATKAYNPESGSKEEPLARPSINGKLR